jgi:uncharacterized membrane protein
MGGAVYGAIPEEECGAVESFGPIQMLTVAFDGNRFKGEILPELDRLKREQIIRVIDLMVVRKDSEGRVMVMTATDLDWEEAASFGSYIGALAGFGAGVPDGVERGAIAGAAELADGHLFDDNDAFRITQGLPNDMSAAIVLIEHVWAKSLLDAIDRAGGAELSNEWIRPEDILSVGQAATTRDDLA